MTSPGRARGPFALQPPGVGTRRPRPVGGACARPAAPLRLRLRGVQGLAASSSVRIVLPARGSRTVWFRRCRSLRSSSSAVTPPCSSAWPTAPSATIT